MKSIAGYEFVEQAAVGSTGVVWKGRQVDLGRVVAIKELSPELRNTPAGLARFRAEAARLAELDDEHVVKVYDYVETESGAFIIQEWVDGETLEAVLHRTRRLSPEQAVGVLRGALLGLAAAHDLGLVHGDVSPTNILLDRVGTSKLIDFGIATPVGDRGGFGTPAYISPEAASGLVLLPASDVYSAAAVLFTLLSGKPPMPGPDIAAVLRQHREQPAPRLEGHGAELRQIIQAAMAKDPLARPPDARAFLRELEEAAEQRFGAGWLSRAGVAGLVGAGAGGGVGALTIATSGGGGGAASAVSAPLVVSALDQEPTGRPFRRRRPGRKAITVGGAILVLAAAGTVVSLATTAGKPAPVSSSTAVPQPAPATSKATSAALVRPAARASIEASAMITTTWTVTGACSGQGGFKSRYRFVGTHVPAASNGLAFTLTRIAGADYIVAPPATIQCPGFSFPLTASGVDKVLTTGTVGQTLRLTATDVTRHPGIPPDVPADNVYVAVDAIPTFIGKALTLRACTASRGATGGRAIASPYRCVPAGVTYRVTVPLSPSAAECEAKSSPTADPVNVSCHSSGTLILVIHTYAT